MTAPSDTARRAADDETTWRFDEEREPCGEAGKLEPVFWGDILSKSAPDLSDCLAVQVPTHPWFLIVWEPLPTDAPGPHLVQPYCCYARTVIFYDRSWTVDPAHGGFKDYGKIETRLSCWTDALRFNGEEFTSGGGRVVWRQNRWWMLHWARRKSRDAA